MGDGSWVLRLPHPAEVDRAGRNATPLPSWSRRWTLPSYVASPPISRFAWRCPAAAGPGATASARIPDSPRHDLCVYGVQVRRRHQTTGGPTGRAAGLLVDRELTERHSRQHQGHRLPPPPRGRNGAGARRSVVRPAPRVAANRIGDGRRGNRASERRDRRRPRRRHGNHLKVDPLNISRVEGEE